MEFEEDRHLLLGDGPSKGANTHPRQSLKASTRTIHRLQWMKFDKEFSKNRTLISLAFIQAVQHLLAMQRLLIRLYNYAREHPIQFGFQVLGVVICMAAVITIPALAAIGFSSAGPVAGTTAAAWQASIGLVEAGSIFAWCQSAAMGGAAVGGIVATGVSGFTVAAAATIPKKIQGWKDSVVGFFRR